MLRLKSEPPTFGDLSPAEQADECEAAAILLGTSQIAGWYRRFAADIRADAALGAAASDSTRAIR